MSSELRQRLTAAFVPMPLEPLIFRVLAQDEPAQRHAELLTAWEVYAQLAGTSIWAVCRSLGLRSDNYDRWVHGLRRPSFGHWVEIAKEGARLLDGRTEPEALALKPLLEGLSGRRSGNSAFDALNTRFSELTPPLKVSGKTVLDLLGAMPGYRNKAFAHAEVELSTTELEDHGDALLDALIELLHLAPPHGTYRWAVIQRIEQSGDDRQLRLGIAHGSHVISESAAAPAGVGGALRVGDVVLVGAEHRFVGLSPLVAAAKRDGVWELGLLKQELRAPRFQYAPYVGAAFRAEVDAAQYADLLGSGPETEDAALDAAVAAMNPYRGLLAYHEEHAPLFFGRAESTDRALAMLEARGVAVVVGSSGSGKSSLMRAGVLAHRVAECDAAGRRLERILLRPGEHPMSALRNALRSIELDSPSEAADWEERIARLLPKDVAAAQSDGLRHLLAGLTRTRDVTLAVDQLEEAVTLCTGTAERDAFLDALTTVAQDATEIGAHLVMTVRADLLAGLFDHSGMREVIRGHLVTLGALGRGDLLEVVRGPLRGRSVSVEDGLAERIVRDVGDEPGKLALLSQVLTTMWAERGKHGNRLTKDAYRSLGGVDGALRTQADAAWARIPEADRAAADRALTRLANLGDDGRLVRSRPSLGEVAEAAGIGKSEVRALLAPFIEARLLVVGEPDPDPTDAAADDVVVEVAHEALLRSWPRLHDQLRASQEAIALRQKIGAAQAAWAGRQGKRVDRRDRQSSARRGAPRRRSLAGDGCGEAVHPVLEAVRSPQQAASRACGRADRYHRRRLVGSVAAIPGRGGRGSGIPGARRGGRGVHPRRLQRRTRPARPCGGRRRSARHDGGVLSLPRGRGRRDERALLAALRAHSPLPVPGGVGTR